jgi:ATP-dependent DNA helicase RecQ
MDRASIDRLTGQRMREWQEVQAYVDTPDCLMRFLAHALDDDRAQPCGRCANCAGAPVVSLEFSRPRAAHATRFLRQAELPLECRVQVAPGAFVQYRWRGNLPTSLRAEMGRVLSRWGDAGWGTVVASEKHDGSFGDELVEAVASMIENRWSPRPAPTWLTCVPSLLHPGLVPDFAQRVAERLRLPFLPVVRKARANEPQKLQRNRYHQ